MLYVAYFSAEAYKTTKWTKTQGRNLKVFHLRLEPCPLALHPSPGHRGREHPRHLCARLALPRGRAHRRDRRAKPVLVFLRTGTSLLECAESLPPGRTPCRSPAHLLQRKYPATPQVKAKGLCPSRGKGKVAPLPISELFSPSPSANSSRGKITRKSPLPLLPPPSPGGIGCMRNLLSKGREGR